MKKKASCPTCGTKVTRLHGPEWRTCNSCNRTNPRAFPYCGWCASPMENTEMRRKLSEVAAPPGGWPSLASELLEVRFFMERGNFADAFELLAILRQRYPLHPELEEYTESSRPMMGADTGVHQVVDQALADSSSLSGTSLGRRAAPTWNAPHAKKDSAAPTGSHTAIPADEFDEEVPASRRRGGKLTQRGHRPVAAVPVRPILPADLGTSTAKKKKKKKRGKAGAKQPGTQRYLRADAPGKGRGQPVEPLAQPPVRKRVHTDPVRHSPAPAPVEAAVPEPVVDVQAEAPLPAAAVEPPPNERSHAGASGQIDLGSVDAPGAVGALAFDEGTPAPGPAPVGRSDTEPLDPDEIEELAPTAGILYSEPETEAAMEAEREEQIAAARRAAAKRAFADAARAAAEARVVEEAAAKAAAQEAAQEAQMRAAEEEAARAERQAADEAAQQQADAVQRLLDEEADREEHRRVAQAAYLAVEEAMKDIPDEARTGQTHVGPAPEAPAVTGDTAVREVPKAPAVTGDTAVGEVPRAPAVTGDTAVGEAPTAPEVAKPQVAASGVVGEIVHREAPQVRVETAVGLPPSAEPGYVPPRGLTMAVDALQPATPFANAEEESTPRKKKGRGRQPRKRSMKPRKRSGKLTPVTAEQQQQERQEKVRRRAARFGEGILGK